jgi:hypothetical protein
MTVGARASGLALAALLLAACATTQSRYVPLDRPYPSLPEGAEVTVFRHGAPDRPFVRVSRLDVHLEKTHFVGSTLDDALPELMRQARRSGAEAIIEIEEARAQVGETKIYHVTAVGIRYR